MDAASYIRSRVNSAPTEPLLDALPAAPPEGTRFSEVLRAPKDRPAPTPPTESRAPENESCEIRRTDDDANRGSDSGTTETENATAENETAASEQSHVEKPEKKSDKKPVEKKNDETAASVAASAQVVTPALPPELKAVVAGAKPDGKEADEAETKVEGIGGQPDKKGAGSDPRMVNQNKSEGPPLIVPSEAATVVEAATAADVTKIPTPVVNAAEQVVAVKAEVAATQKPSPVASKGEEKGKADRAKASKQTPVVETRASEAETGEASASQPTIATSDNAIQPAPTSIPLEGKAEKDKPTSEAEKKDESKIAADASSTVISSSAPSASADQTPQDLPIAPPTVDPASNSPAPTASHASAAATTLVNPSGSPAARIPNWLKSTAEPSAERGPVVVDSTRFLQRVAKAFEAAEARGGDVRLRLSPPELGAVHIELRVREGVLSARLETETHSAQTALIDNLPALKERLAEQGMRIENFEVNVGGRGNNGSAFDRPQDRPDSQQSPAPRPVATAGRTETRAEPTVRPRILAGDGKLNVIV